MPKRCFSPLMLFLVPAIWPMTISEAHAQITGSSARTGTQLSITGPSAAAQLRAAFPNIHLRAGPVELDGRQGTISVDVAGLAMEFGENLDGQISADLQLLDVGIQGSGPFTTTWVEVRLPGVGSLRLELDGVAGPGLITSSAAYEGAPPATPWRLIGTREGQSGPQVLLEGNRDRDGVHSGVGRFFVTSSRLTENTDMNAACKREFGATARLADWQDVLEARRQTLDASAILPTNSPSVYLSASGNHFYSSGRHYLVARHDGAPPASFLAHAQINRNEFSLGSWYGERSALCFLPFRP